MGAFLFLIERRLKSELELTSFRIIFVFDNDSFFMQDSQADDTKTSTTLSYLN